MNRFQEILNCVRRPLKRDDRILLWVVGAVMLFMVLYTGVLWYALFGVPIVVSLVWVCRPQVWWLKLIHGFLLGLFWLISLFCFGQWIKYYGLEVYKVPTVSMEQTIIPGDRVLVCKWLHGARQFTDKGSERLLGIRSIRRGDVVVFNSPESTGERYETGAGGEDWNVKNSQNIRSRTVYVKRCVALPGDVVELRESELWVNGEVQEVPLFAVFRYRFSFSDSLALQQAVAWLERSSIFPLKPPRFPSSSQLEMYLTRQEADSVSKLPGCTEFHTTHSRPTTAVYPHHDSLVWSMNVWGAMRMPRQGDSLVLTKENIRLYAPLVEQHEGHLLTLAEDGTAWVDGVPQRSYVFAKDYYFMMGDHRMESQDSRIIGAIPDDHIIGKATRITWSVNPDPNASHRFRWNRFFKVLQ
jgi:signal peptidase I